MVSAISGGAAYYLYNKNIGLHELLAIQKRDNELFVSIHNQQITHLATVIEKQNTAVDSIRRAGDQQVVVMSKVQNNVNDMRVAADQHLAELRKQPVANLTCEQSIQSLIDYATLLNKGVAK
jgi:hypothetical protein